MRSSLYLMLTVLILASGCSMAPKLDMQTLALPASIADTNASLAIDDKWWEAFGDAHLNSLVEEALLNNDDLKLALSSVAQARATLGLREAERYPDINAGASGLRQKTSGESLSPFAGVQYDTFSLSASAAYEFDFWGRYKNSEEAALSELLASEADKETIRISLVSSVAELYFNLVALQRQVNVTEETIHAYKESYTYRLNQYKHGVIDALTLEQAHALYANAKLTLASLQERKILSGSALAVLLGKSPKEIFEERIRLKTAVLPQPLTIPSGLDSNLLEQRPDIRASQERLAAANALIGVAKADYFPSISLTGSAGLQSTELGNLMRSSAGMWSFGPSISIPLFDFGRTENRVKSAEEQKTSAMISYAKTVKNAFKEVYDSLKKIEMSHEKIRAQNEATQALQKVFTISQKRFDSGYGTYLEVVDAKRGLLSSLINTISLDAELVINQITLYKALGGGWKATKG